MVKQMGHYFPELLAQSSLISKVIKEEEESFLNTLSKGLLRLEKLTQRSRTISGKDAFELYDTYGFPIDLTQLIASEKNIAIDISEFNIELKKQINMPPPITLTLVFLKPVSSKTLITVFIASLY